VFEERLAELLAVIRTTVDFGRLEKVEIGGTKARAVARVSLVALSDRGLA
jgi:hypothetical protein